LSELPRPWSSFSAQTRPGEARMIPHEGKGVPNPRGPRVRAGPARGASSRGSPVGGVPRGVPGDPRWCPGRAPAWGFLVHLRAGAVSSRRSDLGFYVDRGCLALRRGASVVAPGELRRFATESSVEVGVFFASGSAGRASGRRPSRAENTTRRGTPVHRRALQKRFGKIHPALGHPACSPVSALKCLGVALGMPFYF